MDAAVRPDPDPERSRGMDALVERSKPTAWWPCLRCAEWTGVLNGKRLNHLCRRPPPDPCDTHTPDLGDVPRVGLVVAE